MNIVLFKDSFEKNAIRNSFFKRGINSLFFSNYKDIIDHTDLEDYNSILIDYQVVKYEIGDFINLIRKSNPVIKIMVIIDFADNTTYKLLQALKVNKVVFKPFSLKEIIPFITQEKE